MNLVLLLFTALSLLMTTIEGRPYGAERGWPQKRGLMERPYGFETRRLEKRQSSQEEKLNILTAMVEFLVYLKCSHPDSDPQCQNFEKGMK